MQGTINRPFWQRFNDVFYHLWTLALDQAVYSKSARRSECAVDSRQRAVIPARSMFY
jgi:hypothetical protein